MTPVTVYDDGGKTNEFPSQATTDAYADLGSPWHVTALAEKTIFVRETGGVNNAKYKILGSLDGVNYAEVVAEQTLTAGTAASHSISEFWADLKIQVASGAAASPATVEADGGGVPA